MERSAAGTLLALLAMAAAAQATVTADEALRELRAPYRSAAARSTNGTRLVMGGPAARAGPQGLPMPVVPAQPRLRAPFRQAAPGTGGAPGGYGVYGGSPGAYGAYGAYGGAAAARSSRVRTPGLPPSSALAWAVQARMHPRFCCSAALARWRRLSFMQ
jgi:hypothetical protein